LIIEIQCAASISPSKVTPDLEQAPQSDNKKHPDALLLAGTVMTETQAKDAINAGASGIVSADYIPAVETLSTRSNKG